ncbi:hypothetical protein [Streptomyces californicus]|uniref:hypothetical protein n=1 Tax=Streptomyces californicus TaxID=67351 RepID=UPI00371E6B8E
MDLDSAKPGPLKEPEAEDPSSFEAQEANDTSLRETGRDEPSTELRPDDASGIKPERTSTSEPAETQSETRAGVAEHAPIPGDASFDPGMHHGALKEKYRSGVEDPRRLFDAEDRGKTERQTAERLAQEGWHVAPREADHAGGKSNPDAMVRRYPEDKGTVTEFKNLKSGTPTSIKRNIIEAGDQVGKHGGGDVVIDGRAVGLSEEKAERGYRRAAGQAKSHRQAMPASTYFILGDNEIKKIEYKE